MRLFRERDLGWAVETADGLFELESPWIHLMDGEPMLGDPIERAPKFEAPVEPSKIVCVGLNYEHHAEEQGKAIPPEPLMFMKPPTAITAPGGAIEIPTQSELVHHEGELAVVIGRRLHQANEAEATRAIFGYTCANDVTARDIQRREKRYTRSKGFDTFCPLGPCVVMARDFVPAEHSLEVRVNGDVRQASSLDDFIFEIPFVVSFISHVMTLLPGDVILTGTPAGVGPLLAGDRVEVEIDEIGVLTNTVV
jgi:2-keto-4-pentenoate hydratase/2-oxohepta-3-ene-1,7-dioic acid hydratase in catechol pathway